MSDSSSSNCKQQPSSPPIVCSSALHWRSVASELRKNASLQLQQGFSIGIVAVSHAAPAGRNCFQTTSQGELLRRRKCSLSLSNFARGIAEQEGGRGAGSSGQRTGGSGAAGFGASDLVAAESELTDWACWVLLVDRAMSCNQTRV